MSPLEARDFFYKFNKTTFKLILIVVFFIN